MACRCKCGAATTKHCWKKSDWTPVCEFCGKITKVSPCLKCVEALEDAENDYKASLIESGIEPDKDIPF